MLERSIPFYLQIARILRRELADGIYPVSSRMPDELALAARFGVSKDVIRVSMRMLAKEQLVKPIRSRGTFVCEHQANIGRSFVLMSYHGPIHLADIRNGIDSVMPPHCNLVLKNNTLDELEVERDILDNLSLSDIRVLISAPANRGTEDNTAAYARILNNGVPVLIIDHSLPNLPADEISFDEYGATKHLVLESLRRIGERPAVMFVEADSKERLSKIRYQAMIDAWRETGGSSATRRLVNYVNPCTAHFSDEARAMLSAMGKNDWKDYAILCRGTPIAWELCQILRECGQENAVFQYSGIGDLHWGDDAFNDKLYAHYRLFDEFTPLISEVLTLRLSGEQAPSTPIRKTLGFKEMTGEEIRQYVIRKLVHCGQ